MRNPGLPTCKALGRLYSFENGVVGSGPDVEGGPFRSLPFDSQGDRPAHVGHVRQVPALGTIAIDRDGFPAAEFPLELLQSEIGALAVAPDREQAQGHEAQAIYLGIQLAPLLAL